MDDTSTASVETPAAPAAEPSAPATPPPAPTTAESAIKSVLAKHSAAPQETVARGPAAEGGDSTASKKGPVPFPDHDKAVKNAREKGRQEALSEWKPYEWAKGIDRGLVEQAVNLAQQYGQDRAGYIRSILSEAVQDPTLAQVVRSEAARILASGSMPAAESEPELDVRRVQFEDGTIAEFPTVESVRKREAWLRQQMQADFLKQVQPAMQTADELRTAKEHYAAAMKADQFATTAYAELQQLPQFKEHQQEIAAELAKTKLVTGEPAEVMAATQSIYHRIVLPKLSQTAQASTLAELKQKAAAQVETTSGAAPATIARPKNPKDLAKFLEARAAARR